MNYRRIFTDNDRRAWEMILEEIPDVDGSAFMPNSSMAERLGLRESRQGSRYFHRLEQFGLIVCREVRHPVTHSMCRKVWRNDNGVVPGFTERASMVVIREVGA